VAAKTLDSDRHQPTRPEKKSVGDQPADLARSVEGGVQFGLELWVHAAGAGASCSRRWAPGAPAEANLARDLAREAQD